ncbi:MAG: four helix bundle protein [Candidatus Doudnabacteria bacterium]|nr:four helix bundle protein [Candidatus Doudnabacteria bacterium]
MTNSIKNFSQLVVWQEAHKLAVKVYGFTDAFPRHEKFGLSSQLQRAAVSVPSNIAEGFKRGSSKEKVQFYRTADGSLSELESQLILARDLSYLNESAYKDLLSNINSVNRLLNAFIKSASKIPNTKYHLPNTSSGFTLIEIIVVVAMFAMTMLILADLFVGQNQIYRTQTAELNVTSDARVALDEVDAAVRAADVVAGSFGSFTTGPQTLVLQIPAINASNQIIAATYDYMVYYLNGTNFFRQIIPNAASSRSAQTKKLASNVTGLLFSYDNADLAAVKQVATDVTVQETASRYTRSITLSSKSKLRNN